MEKELQSKTSKVYQPRKPERTTLYQVVQTHLESWLEQVHAIDNVPKHIERDYRDYMKCGILAYGFARVHCDSCQHDYLIAYSCKGRGICPSCNTKHMSATAMHLVEEVFPNVPVRQWVLSFPKRIRYYLHRDNELTDRVLKQFQRLIEKHLKTHSPKATDKSRYGGVTFIQRFGSSLNAHLHFHSCVMDGVYTTTEEGIHFHQATPPTQATIHTLEETLRKRVLSLFKRHYLLTEETVEDMLSWENSGF